MLINNNGIKASSHFTISYPYQGNILKSFWTKQIGHIHVLYFPNVLKTMFLFIWATKDIKVLFVLVTLAFFQNDII